MIKAVIFGFNGVIYNSTPYVAKARNKYLERFGIKRAKKDISKTLGMALKDQISFWNQQYGLDLDYETFSEETRELAKRFMIKEKVKPNPGVIKLMKSLRQNKIKIGIASFMPKDFLFEDLEMLGFSWNYFDAITSLEDVKKYRPNPEFLLTETKKLKVNPEECAYISDDNGGLLVAKTIDMKTIGLVNQFQAQENFKNADLVIHFFKDLNVEKIIDLGKK